MDAPRKEPQKAHQWRFLRSGGFDQVRLETGEDLLHLAELDPKLWAVLNCPSRGLEFDPRTAALLDIDGDGQIRQPEVLQAVQWACARLRNPDLLFSDAGLPVAAINDEDDTGKALKAAAQRGLEYLGKAPDEPLLVSDLTDMTRLFSPHHYNGDGVITPQLGEDEALQTLISEIVSTQGSEIDRSGVPGVTADMINAFYEVLESVLSWQAGASPEDTALFPLGEDTAAAAVLLEQAGDKIDDYFMRCQLTAFDSRAAERLNPAAATYELLANRSLSGEDTDISALPLAAVEAGKPLPLSDGINPAWADTIRRLKDTVITPLLGEREQLTPDEWRQVRDRFATYRSWQEARPDTLIHQLGEERLKAIQQADQRDTLLALVAEDLAAKPFADTIDAVERLVRYQRDLVTLLRNFVTLSDFYGRQKKAIFQIGTLYIDQRSCELVMRVNDAARHTTMAPFSGCYLLYCSCERKGHEPMEIAAALTGGSVNELMVPGRNGVFYDREGRDWRATIVRVVEQPVSLRQAFWSPYRRVAALVEQQLHKFAASRDKDIEAKAATGVVGATVVSPLPQTFDIARFAGIFAAIGLAVGAIGTALAAALVALFALSWWQIPLVLLGLMVVISGPAVMMAYLTLRRRNLGPLLDANGWAVNTRALINVPFGASLTGVAKLPPGATRALRDPYADKAGPGKLWLLLAAVVAVAALVWYQGWLPWG